MNLLDELSIEHSKEDKEFLRDNINSDEKKNYDYLNENKFRFFKEARKRRAIMKVTDNISLLKKLNIEASQEDLNIIRQYKEDDKPSETTSKV